MNEEDKTRVEKVLASHDALAAETEKKIVSSAIPANQPKQKLNRFKYTGLEDLEKEIAFQYPRVSFMVVTNLDTLDADGFPTSNTHKIRAMRVDYNATNTYSHGKLIGAQVRQVNIEFGIASCMVKNGAVAVKAGYVSTVKQNEAYNY